MLRLPVRLSCGGRLRGMRLVLVSFSARVEEQEGCPARFCGSVLLAAVWEPVVEDSDAARSGRHVLPRQRCSSGIINRTSTAIQIRVPVQYCIV